MSARSVCLWHVELNDGVWFRVFATSESQARQIVVSVHYEDMRIKDFVREFRPKISRVPPGKVISCVEFDGVSSSMTAAEWAKDAEPGPFMSNSYEDEA